MFTSKYQELSHKIEAYIAENKLEGKLPGVRRLACLFHVNKITVNKALWLLEERGILAIDSGRGCRILHGRPRHGVIGVVGLDNTPGNNQLLEWIGERCRARGYRIIGLFVNFKEDIELLLRFPVDGYIFLGSYANREILEFLHDKGIAVIGSSFYVYPWLNRVSYDHKNGYRQLLAYLKRIGHHRIAFAEKKRKAEYASYTDGIREVFQETLQENFDPELFLLYDDLENIPQEVAGIAEYFTRLPSPPSVIIGSSGLIPKLGSRLRSLGFSIPNDFSLVMTGHRHQCPRAYTALLSRTDDLLLHAAYRMIEILEGNRKETGQYNSPMLLRIGRSVTKSGALNQNEIPQR